MDFVSQLKEKAKSAGKKIVLCEGEDKRVVEAAAKIVKDGIAKIFSFMLKVRKVCVFCCSFETEF